MRRDRWRGEEMPRSNCGEVVASSAALRAQREIEAQACSITEGPLMPLWENARITRSVTSVSSAFS